MGTLDAVEPTATCDPSLTTRHSTRDRSWGSVFTVAAIAAAVQAGYLAEARRAPTFGTPIVDAGVYHEAASRFARGEALSNGAFWQPPLFPVALGGLYALTGPSVPAAKLFLAALAVGSCLLLQAIGRRLFTPGVGLLAGVIAATYGPFVFFSTELMPVGPAVFLDLLAIVVWIRCIERPSWLRWTAFGVVTGATAITVPNGGVLMALAIVGLLRSAMSVRCRRGALNGALACLAGFAAVLAPVTMRNRAVSGEWVLISTNGGMNFYIGNNRETERTLAIRPGEEWRRLGRQPAVHGAVTRTEQSEYFYKEGLRFLTDDPRRFLAGLARKTMELINAREIPRNLDPYIHREDSTILSALMWRIGPLAFPFGLLLPLAAVGLTAALGGAPNGANVRTKRAFLAAFVVTYGCSVVAFFVSARYRLPMAVGMIPFAAFGLPTLWHSLRRRASAWPVVVFVMSAVACNLPMRSPTDGVHFRAEEALCIGVARESDHRLEEAESSYRNALRLDPRHSAAAARLGALLDVRGKSDDAERLLRDALTWDDQAVEPRLALAGLLREHRRTVEAATLYREVLAIDPTSSDTHGGLASLLIQSNDLSGAIAHLNQAVRFAEEPGPWLVQLADALAQSGAYGEAIERYRQALWHVEPDAALLNRIAWLLATCPEVERRDCRNAIELAERLCRETGHTNAVALDTLAAAYAECGRFDEAVTHARHAIDRASLDHDEAAIEAFRTRLRVYEERLHRAAPKTQRGP